MTKQTIRSIVFVAILVVAFVRYVVFPKDTPAEPPVEPQITATVTTFIGSIFLPIVEAASTSTESQPTPAEQLKATAAVDLAIMNQALQGVTFAYDGTKSRTGSFKSIVEFTVVTSGHMERGTATSVANAGAFIPQMSGTFGPPTTKGNSCWLVGYDWLDAGSKYYHPATDIRCTCTPNSGETCRAWPDPYPWFWRFEVGAPTECTVTAIIREEVRANSYTSSGVTALCATKATYNGQNVTMTFGSGHLDSDSIEVVGGQTLHPGQKIGEISTYETTGNTTGPHNHYFIIVEYADGTREYVNPHNFNGMGNW